MYIQNDQINRSFVVYPGETFNTIGFWDSKRIGNGVMRQVTKRYVTSVTMETNSKPRKAIRQNKTTLTAIQEKRCTQSTPQDFTKKHEFGTAFFDR
jgi:hypothetical protein